MPLRKNRPVKLFRTHFWVVPLQVRQRGGRNLKQGGARGIFGLSDAPLPAYESFDDVEGALFEEHDWLAYSVDAFIKVFGKLLRGVRPSS